MRNYMDILKGALNESAEVEAPVTEAPTRTRTKKPTDQMTLDISGPTSKGELTTGRKTTDVSRPAEPKLPGKAAGAEKTKKSFKGFANPGEAGGHMRDIMSMVGDTQDEISDDEAAQRAGHTPGAATDGYRQPPTPQNLPAIINTAVAASGMEIQPEWHMVKHLPGYMQSGIRALGRQLFGQFTDTPIEEIQVLSTLSNDDIEVKAMFTWLKRNAVKDDDAQIKFDNSPASRYGADVQIWNAEGFTFMCVKDQMGYYVYSWPGGRGTQVGNDGPMRQIR
ncbi:MAG: hypothetical protein EOP83_05405 [Verrucomicrobiaceae bacterium]|nr:MAG: hypothetical protein EOP83_05405 [Verrucomicrobiaceae bacterium]